VCALKGGTVRLLWLAAGTWLLRFYVYVFATVLSTVLAFFIILRAWGGGGMRLFRDVYLFLLVGSGIGDLGSAGDRGWKGSRCRDKRCRGG
jgi:hypothetical protein